MRPDAPVMGEDEITDGVYLTADGKAFMFPDFVQGIQVDEDFLDALPLSRPDTPTFGPPADDDDVKRTVVQMSPFSLLGSCSGSVRGSCFTDEPGTLNREHSTELEHELRKENRETRTTRLVRASNDVVNAAASRRCGRSARASARARLASREGCRVRG